MSSPVPHGQGPGRDGWLAAQLPRPLAADPFLARFVRIFEEVGGSVRDRVDGIEHHLDVGIAPLELVRWMGAWLGVAVDAALPDARQRELVRAAGPLLAWRGTRRGLEGLLRALVGGPVEVRDTGGAYAEGQAPTGDHRITIHLEGTGGVDEHQLLALIHGEVPVDAEVELVVDTHAVEAPAQDEQDEAEISDAAPEPLEGQGYLPPMIGSLEGDDDPTPPDAGPAAAPPHDPDR